MSAFTDRELGYLGERRPGWLGRIATVVRRNGRAAIVIDDLASLDPWQPRGIEIRGRAEDGHTGVTRNLCSPSRSTLVPRRRQASASLVEIQSASPP
jgi:hypothetical protein